MIEKMKNSNVFNFTENEWRWGEVFVSSPCRFLPNSVACNILLPNLFCKAKYALAQNNKKTLYYD